MKKESSLAIIEFQKTWIDNDTFQKMLRISRRTAQDYRDRNLIPYVIIGNKIWYNASDIDNLMKNNLIKAKIKNDKNHEILHL